MTQHAVQTLPPNYNLFWHFDLARTRELLWVNLVGILLLFASGIGFAALAQRLRPQAFSPGSFFVRLSILQLLVFIGEVLLVTPVMVVVHEGLHGLFFRVFTGSRPKFALKLTYAYAAAPDWYIRRGPYFIIGLAPLLGITLLGILGMIVLPPVCLFPLYLLLVLNTSGAAGDLWTVGKLLFCPTDTLIRDCGDSIEFFAPQD
jgi:hypothetical protein